MIAELDVVEVLLGIGILVYGWVLIHIIDFNDEEINDDSTRTN